MDIQNTLTKIGLTNNEASTYLSLLNLNSVSAGELAKRTNQHRRTVYDVLTALLEQGLISYTIKDKKKYYNAKNPEQLLEILKEREFEVEKVLPELKEIYKNKSKEMLAEVYEGKEGIKTLMNEILKTKKEWLTIGSTGKGLKIYPVFLEQFAKKRIELKIKRRVLFVDTAEGRNYLKEIKKQPYTECRILPKIIKSPQMIWVFENKVAILAAEDYPIAFLINNREIANSYREYFEVLWEKSN